MLSLVLPIFNEELVIDELHRRLGEFFGAVGTTWEVVFVDDGSSDGSFGRLKQLCTAEPRYALISLSRNFGHQFAITAGLDYARRSSRGDGRRSARPARGRRRHARAISRRLRHRARRAANARKGVDFQARDGLCLLSPS